MKEQPTEIQAPYDTSGLDQQLIAERAAELLVDYEYPPLPESDYSDGPELYEPLVILRPENVWCAKTARIDSFVKLEAGDGMVIGEHVHIASYCHVGIGGGITILEDESCMASGSRLISGSNIMGRGRSCSAVAPGILIYKYATILGYRAVMYAGSTLLPGLRVGENAVVMAGATVTKDIPAFEVWGGVPARKLGEVPDIE